jgi:hypothetical protein
MTIKTRSPKPTVTQTVLAYVFAGGVGLLIAGAVIAAFELRGVSLVPGVPDQSILNRTGVDDPNVSTKQLVANTARVVCGSDARKVESFPYFNPVRGDAGISCHVSGLTEALDRVADMAGVLFRRSEVKELSVMVYEDFVDPYGKESEDKSFFVDLTRALYERIEWKNIDGEQFARLLSGNWNDNEKDCPGAPGDHGFDYGSCGSWVDTFTGATGRRWAKLIGYDAAVGAAAPRPDRPEW